MPFLFFPPPRIGPIELLTYGHLWHKTHPVAINDTTWLDLEENSLVHEPFTY